MIWHAVRLFAYLCWFAWAARLGHGGASAGAQPIWSFSDLFETPPTSFSVSSDGGLVMLAAPNGQGCAQVSDGLDITR
eukprot:scaffold294479_cov27-Prasinocladus_malaysianus.AAC.1